MILRLLRLQICVMNSSLITGRQGQGRRTARYKRDLMTEDKIGHRLVVRFRKCKRQDLIWWNCKFQKYKDADVCWNCDVPPGDAIKYDSPRLVGLVSPTTFHQPSRQCPNWKHISAFPATVHRSDLCRPSMSAPFYSPTEPSSCY